MSQFTCRVCKSELGWDRPSGVCSEACLRMAQGFPARGLYEKCERVIRTYPDWSRVERSKMDTLVEEIMDHVINGGGNKFVQTWCENVLMPSLAQETGGRM